MLTVGAITAVVIGVVVAISQGGDDQVTPGAAPTEPAVTSTATVTVTQTPAPPDTPSETPAPGAPLACPASIPVAIEGGRIEEWVPALPEGVDGAAAMVPAATPLTAVICRYDPLTEDMMSGKSPEPQGQIALTKAASLTGDLSGIPRDLGPLTAGDPAMQPCPKILRPLAQFLIGLTYADGTLWVGTRSGCAGTANGVFISAEGSAEEAEASHAAGRWVELTP